MALIPTPWPALKLFDLIPGYIYAAAIALLVIGGGGALAFEHMSLLKEKTTTAQLREQAVTDRAEREHLTADYMKDLADVQEAHAAHQQEIVDAYQKTKLELARLTAGDADRVERVRVAAAEQAARDRAAAAHDPAACKRVADRNETLSGLLAAGYGVVTEGRRVVGTRDAEVAVLMGLIKNDRAAICGEKK